MAAGAWEVLVGLALAATLDSLHSDEFDGLNNILQIPLALPWWFLVPYPGNHIADAWVAAGAGTFNAVLIYLAVRRYSSGITRRPSRWDRR